MIFTSVDVEALRYLRAKGEVGREFEAYLLENISYGYQRELTYRHRDGWFNAHVCPSATGSLWLTSYCLSVFSQARQLVTIDEEVLASAATWILGHQQADGGWEPVGWVHNRSLYGGLSGNYALTAFVTVALANYGGANTSALAAARAYLEDRLAEAETAPALAVGAYALAILESPLADGAVDRLLALAKEDAEGRLYWEPVPVETTAYAALALHEVGRPLEASSAAAWLAARKNARGGFGNTQDTVMALRALVRDALAGQEATDLALDVLRDGEVLHTLRVDASNFDVVQQIALDPGPPVTVRATGRGPAAIQLARRYHVPAEVLRSRGGLAIEVDYGRTLVALGEILPAEARIRYTGPREATNMAIAEIGIPTGLRPDRDALQDLVGEGAIRRIDVRRRTITVYLDRILAGETIAIPISFTAAFPAQAAPIPSKAYDYYDPAIEARDEGVALVVAEAGQEIPFLRGDANGDARVDLGDAIRILGHLFGGLGPAACADALDVDDDGILELGDPIALLNYLFAGGTPPAAPFPAPGEDPTEDELSCVMD